MIYPKDVKSLTMSLRTVHPYGDNSPVSLCTMSKTSYGCYIPKLYVPFSWPGGPRFFFYDGLQCPSFFRYCMTAENMLSVGNRDVWWKNQRLTLHRCSKSCSDSAENISIVSLIYLKNMFYSLIFISVSGAHISLNCSIISLTYLFMIWNLTKILEKTWKCTVRTKFQSHFSIIFPVSCNIVTTVKKRKNDHYIFFK